MVSYPNPGKVAMVIKVFKDVKIPFHFARTGRKKYRMYEDSPLFWLHSTKRLFQDQVRCSKIYVYSIEVLGYIQEHLLKRSYCIHWPWQLEQATCHFLQEYYKIITGICSNKWTGPTQCVFSVYDSSFFYICKITFLWGKKDWHTSCFRISANSVGKWCMTAPPQLKLVVQLHHAWSRQALMHARQYVNTNS